MSAVLTALRMHAVQTPQRVALQNATETLSYQALHADVTRLAAQLRAAAPRSVAIFADNGFAWAVADLAVLDAGIPCVPLPLFFSPDQIDHTLRTAGVDLVLTDRPRALQNIIGSVQGETPYYRTLHVVRLSPPATTSAAVAKITFTSGTTGDPKGVRLDGDTLDAVARALCDATHAVPIDRHVALLPLSTLLENIAGLHVPLLAGATACLPALGEIGWSGSSRLDPHRLLDALARYRATTAITVPQLLQALVAVLHERDVRLPDLRYVAVGGAPVSPRVLERAHACGLPVYEGYGLSECGSVVAVNRPDAARRGSVGQPLPHLTLAFGEDGEILVRGLRWHGYLGANDDNDVIATGDLGHVDADGFLYVTGRKKNVFVTSFGRNVAPEWVERELTAETAIAQAAVFGEARPFNCAVVVANRDVEAAQIDAAVNAANARLPDYARIQRWLASPVPFDIHNGLATSNGRVRRDAVYRAHAPHLDAFYPPDQGTA